MVNMVEMNESLKQHLLDSLNKNVRFDNRKLEEYREITVECGVSETSEGSARVKIGETEVIAGVKLSIDKPYPDTPDQGSLMVNAELLPLSSPRFEPGPPGIEAIELARVVDRGIREAKAIDVKDLCITKGEKIWLVSIDICTVNDAGNLLDASGLAAIAALKDARFPTYEDGELDYRKKSKNALPLVKLPIPITVHKIGKNFIVDPSIEEEAASDARLTVATIKKGNVCTICALHKGGNTPLTLEDIDKMVEIAIEKAEQMRKFL
jgi:exosome complex component RRP42